MDTKLQTKQELVHKVRDALANEPGLTVKDLANRLRTNRLFMAGVLAVLEDMGKVKHRPVGPARIYFNVDGF